MRPEMKIWSHSESHIVELEDGSQWQVFLGDLDLTLAWKPETDLTVTVADDDVASHALVGGGGKGPCHTRRGSADGTGLTTDTCHPEPPRMETPTCERRWLY